MKHQPQPKTLSIVWIVLMALSGATMIVGNVTNTLSLGMTWMALLLVVTLVKSTLILQYYLDLKSSTSGWSKAFIGLVSVMLVIVFGLYAAGTIGRA